MTFRQLDHICICWKKRKKESKKIMKMSPPDRRKGMRELALEIGIRVLLFGVFVWVAFYCLIASRAKKIKKNKNWIDRWENTYPTKNMSNITAFGESHLNEVCESRHGVFFNHSWICQSFWNFRCVVLLVSRDKRAFIMHILPTVVTALQCFKQKKRTAKYPTCCLKPCHQC